MASLTVPPVLTSPRDDATQLHHAFKGFGCDAEAVINIVAYRDATQRALIQQEYRAMFSADLRKKLASELSGDLEAAVLLWMHDPAVRDAVILTEALKGNCLEVATEVICSRTPSQIHLFKQAYYSMNKVDLKHDIEKHASGDHEKLLVAYISTSRHEGFEVDMHMVEADEMALYKAGEKKMGTDEKTFIRIFSERSSAHLAAINSAYRKKHKKSLKKAVKSETSGKFELALLTILRVAENPAKYFAKELQKAMKGFGTDEKKLTRLIVTRSEIDMQYIKAEYHKIYKKSLNDVVRSEISGNYRTFLLSLLGPIH
ncbi:annexin D5-like [Cornus florida]|uniref:annexin D5-like n=1 Tax=Cornus florida TaxID=4283 RepID=UPI002897618F|nr:annexin D5-like [Cornus florida]